MDSLKKSLEDKAYAVFWAAAGVTKARATAAFVRERRRLEAEWAAGRDAAVPVGAGPMLADLGTAKTLPILPLVEFYTGGPGLAGGPGVSYLVTVDGQRMLFDVGRNVGEELPSPLRWNMEALGIRPEDIELVALSEHDSCDWSLAEFRKTLGERCRTLRVGEEIVVA